MCNCEHKQCTFSVCIPSPVLPLCLSQITHTYTDFAGRVLRRGELSFVNKKLWQLTVAMGTVCCWGLVLHHKVLKLAPKPPRSHPSSTRFTSVSHSLKQIVRIFCFLSDSSPPSPRCLLPQIQDSSVPFLCQVLFLQHELQPYITYRLMLYGGREDAPSQLHIYTQFISLKHHSGHATSESAVVMWSQKSFDNKHLIYILLLFYRIKK